MPPRFPEHILKSRLERFKEKMAEKGIEATMIRTLSSFIYFTGIKWLRPALLIPVDGEPVAFVVRGEEEGFMERTWIKNVVTYTDGGDLMAKVSSRIHRVYHRVGLEFSVERDSYILFYEMFKRLNPGVEIVDVSGILSDMRMIKDDYELEAIRKAGYKANKAMEKALSTIKPGITETEIAAEIYHTLYKLGSEEPLVYINAGPHPRVHSEPFSDVKVRPNTFVTIVIEADHYRYYANKARTIYTGTPTGLAEKAMKCMEEVYEKANQQTRPGKRFIDVMKELDKIYAKYDMLEHRVIGYTHSIGLQIEEAPITTIVPAHRFIQIKPRMTLAYIHAPIMLKQIGQIKKEDTYIITVKDNELVS